MSNTTNDQQAPYGSLHRVFSHKDPERFNARDGDFIYGEDMSLWHMKDAKWVAITGPNCEPLEKAMTNDEMYEEWNRCRNDMNYFHKKYCVVLGDTMHWHIPNWMKAFELIQPIKREESDVAHAQRNLNRMMSESQLIIDQRIASGELIRRDELVAWIENDSWYPNGTADAIYGADMAQQRILDHINKKA